MQAFAGQPTDRNEARAHEDYHLYVENIYARLDLPTIVPELLKQLNMSRPDLAEVINKDYVCESSWASECYCCGGVACCRQLWITFRTLWVQAAAFQCAACRCSWKSRAVKCTVSCQAAGRTAAGTCSG